MSVYFFLGPEAGKKQDAVNSVKNKYPGAEITAFYADETPAGLIADALQNISLFADARIIIIKNSESIKKKDDIDLLVSCIKSITDNSIKNTALIFLSDETKINTSLYNADPKVNRQIFYEMFEREKAEWLKQFFSREGVNIDRNCIDTIIEMVENNTGAFKDECSRLLLFLPKGKQITSDDIEKWLSHNREESAFTLFSRIASGDLSRALESLSCILAAKTSAQSVLAGLAWCFRKLDDYLSLLETGDANNSIELKKIGLSAPKIRDDYTAASRRYNSDSTARCLALTAECDTLLRSPAAVMENIIMERYILSLIRASAI